MYFSTHPNEECSRHNVDKTVLSTKQTLNGFLGVIIHINHIHNGVSIIT
ncbi:MAG: hypothetical protein NTX03_10130 [Bacteroidetes bacterium]|nr:hypothetical protein [Bacteroidota bacterium]